MDNYVMNYALFSPRVIIKFNTTHKYTVTNSCETFHSKFNSIFFSSHSNIFKFTEVIKNLQCDVYIKIRNFGQLSKTTRETIYFFVKN